MARFSFAFHLLFRFFSLASSLSFSPKRTRSRLCYGKRGVLVNSLSTSFNFSLVTFKGLSHSKSRLIKTLWYGFGIVRTTSGSRDVSFLVPLLPLPSIKLLRSRKPSRQETMPGTGRIIIAPSESLVVHVRAFLFVILDRIGPHVGSAGGAST